MRLNGEGVIGEDGGLELVQKGDLFNKIDVLTNNKINKSQSAKKKHYAKSDNLGADDFVSDNVTIIQKKRMKSQQYLLTCQINLKWFAESAWTMITKFQRKKMKIIIQ